MSDSARALAAPRPPLRCHGCHGTLAPVSADSWGCDRGLHRYPVTAGIIDLRPPMETFDVAADRRLAEMLEERPADSFEEALRRYWRHHPDSPPPALVERFVRGDLIGADRAAEVVAQIEQLAGQPLGSGMTALEVGAGTAALGAALAQRAGHVVVSDVSLAWLVLARRRLQARGITNVTLVAATAEALPAADTSFDLVAAADVIEHVPDPAAMVDACYRALKPGGLVWLSTPNRLSLTPEPHVRLWGVGFLPRHLAIRLVRSMRGVDYSDIRTLSAFALRRVLARTAGEVGLTAPAIPQAVRAGYSRPARALIDVYHLARRLPLSRGLLLLVTPLFHAIVRRPR